MAVELFGIIPPLVTPFRDDQELDEEGMRREIRHVLEAGVHGITLSGSTGEGQTLTVEETCRLARIAREEVKGRIPVISGIIQDSTRAVISYGKALKDEGVDALQITPVHYHAAPGVEGNLRYYADIGEAVQLPIVIYNVVPWNTIDVPTLIKLGEQTHVIAVKQSGGDIHKLADLILAVKQTGSNLQVFSAVDALLYSSFTMGADGAIAGILTVLPRLCVALWNACQAGDFERGRDIHEHILPLQRLHETPDYGARIKASLEVQGRHVGPPRLPSLPVSAEVHEQLRQAVEGSGELSVPMAVA